jgi:hypothetical protein
MSLLLGGFGVRIGICHNQIVQHSEGSPNRPTLLLPHPRGEETLATDHGVAPAHRTVGLPLYPAVVLRRRRCGRLPDLPSAIRGRAPTGDVEDGRVRGLQG